MQQEICNHLTYLGYEMENPESKEFEGNIFIAKKNNEYAFHFFFREHSVSFHHAAKGIFIQPDKKFHDIIKFLNKLNYENLFAQYSYNEDIVAITACYFGAYETKAFLYFIDTFVDGIKIFYKAYHDSEGNFSS